MSAIVESSDNTAATVENTESSGSATQSTKIPKSILKDTSGGGSGIKNNHKVNLAAGAGADKPKKMYRTNTIKLKKEGETDEEGKSDSSQTASKGFSSKHKIDQTKRHSIGAVKQEDIITADAANPESPRSEDLTIDMNEIRSRSNSLPALHRNASRDKLKREAPLTERPKKDKCVVC
eukprot:TRINITY_DN4345_c0_g1_i1.p1 TRINITY_DN4345_c0_g1~~TRINITY_DN4345_c0_g1_i1.p1  ORF type:complete len:178 (-),score=37.09 TRINITY_DN4345_c0_g1_i1:332-865(-)